jgi:hypothetical protein
VLLGKRTSLVTHLIKPRELACESRGKATRGMRETPAVEATDRAGSFRREDGDTRPDRRSRDAASGYGVPVGKDDQIACREERGKFSLSDVLEGLDSFDRRGSAHDVSVAPFMASIPTSRVAREAEAEASLREDGFELAESLEQQVGVFVGREEAERADREWTRSRWAGRPVRDLDAVRDDDDRILVDPRDTTERFGLLRFMDDEPIYALPHPPDGAQVES